MKVIQIGDPVLRQICKGLDIDELISDEVQSCATQLIVIMKGLKEISPGNGNGLAAPQIGLPIRLVVIFFNECYNQMFNPKIFDKSLDVFEVTEGCLSYFYLRAPVIRHKAVTVTFQDQFGEHHKKTFSDDLAALVQHELDHLDGILFIDKISDNTKIASIDYALNHNPERLTQVKEMIDYVLD